jgi:hypothetical protein
MKWWQQTETEEGGDEETGRPVAKTGGILCVKGPDGPEVGSDGGEGVHRVCESLRRGAVLIKTGKLKAADAEYSREERKAASFLSQTKADDSGLTQAEAERIAEKILRETGKLDGPAPRGQSGVHYAAEATEAKPKRNEAQRLLYNRRKLGEG